MKVRKGFLIRAAAVVSVSALLLGSGGVASAQEMVQATPTASVSSSSDLQSALNTLFIEHVDLSLTTMRVAYDGFGSPNFQGAAGALDQNSVAIANMVGQVYGPNNQAQFLELWRKHIDYLNTYALATKNNDQNLKQQALNNLNNVAAPGMANFLNQINPNLPVSTVTQELKNHEQDLLNSFDAYAAGDFATSYSGQVTGDSHASMFAAMVANAIVRQYPSQYP